MRNLIKEPITMSVATKTKALVLVSIAAALIGLVHMKMTGDSLLFVNLLIFAPLVTIVAFSTITKHSMEDMMTKEQLKANRVK